MVDSLRFMPLGGGDEIGGSCYWYKFPWARSRYGYLSVVVDCGMRPNSSSGPSLKRIDHLDYIVITHAHADHCVYLPVLARRFPDAVIFMTKETLELCQIQWEDSILAFNRNARKTGEPPLFTREDVACMVRGQIKLISFLHKVELPAGVTMLPIDAGHILGATSLFFVQNLGIGRRHTVFHTGDISFDKQRLIFGAPRRFLPAVEVQTVVSEATNLGGPNFSREEEIKRLIHDINEVFVRGGRVVIPVFKIHRAQEVWEILIQGGIPLSRIFVDGNASGLFDIYQKYTSMRQLPCSQVIKNTEYVRWKMWRDKTPCVILAFGGMVQERSAAWKNMRLVIEDETDALFAVGYMDPCSPGGKLLDRIAQGKKEIRIDLERFEIKCRVDRYRLSSHAGSDDLLGLAERARDCVIWVHGDRSRVKGFLRERAPAHHLLGRNKREKLL